MKALLALILFLPMIAKAAEPSHDFLVEQLVREALDKAEHVNLQKQCSSPVVTAPHFTDLLKKRRETVLKDAHGNTQKLSILTPKEASELQAYVNGDQSLAHGFTEDGCEQRAIEITRILRTQGIQAVVISAFPGGFQESGSFSTDFPGEVPGVVWRHHIAPTIAVQEGGRVVIKVIDPALSKSPLTKAQWTQLLQKRSSVDDPVDLYVSTGNYSEDAVEKANAQLRIYGEAQKKREAIPAN